MSHAQALWSESPIPDTYAEARRELMNLNETKRTTKRQILAEKQDLVSLFSNICTKLRAYVLAPYRPPTAFTLTVCLS